MGILSLPKDNPGSNHPLQVEAPARLSRFKPWVLLLQLPGDHADEWNPTVDSFQIEVGFECERTYGSSW